MSDQTNTNYERLKDAASNKSLSIGEAWNLLDDAADAVDRLERELAECESQRRAAKDSEISALLLVSKIRVAVGDPEGKLMQDELLARCANLAKDGE